MLKEKTFFFRLDRSFFYLFIYLFTIIILERKKKKKKEKIKSQLEKNKTTKRKGYTRNCWLYHWSRMVLTQFSYIFMKWVIFEELSIPECKEKTVFYL